MNGKNERYSAKGYLIAAIFTLIISAFYSIQAWPLFIKWFVPFPTLEQTTIYEGTLHIEGVAHSSKFGDVAPAYYMMSKDGPHKIFWGFPGSEKERFLAKETYYEGVVGRVWYHPMFGVIQDEFTATPSLMEKYTVFKESPKFGRHYETGPRLTFEKYFNYEKYEWALLTPCVGLILSIYFFIQYRKSKQA